RLTTTLSRRLGFGDHVWPGTDGPQGQALKTGMTANLSR
ncbi:MAG: hypothetical protein QOG59_2687, partial [Solirubrobacteraceae bacterium]|nr:hypothetical protein [Solirubrobacteraceae bacterium]